MSTVPQHDTRSASSPGNAPVFVVGCPRSGTTLLYHMLLSAGNFVNYRAESQIFNLLEPRFGDLRRERNRNAMLAAWSNSPLFKRTGLTAEDINAERVAHCRNGGDFLRVVMELIAQKQGVSRWADCTPEHALFLNRIKQTIPEALIIHVLRDGRDVAMSLEKQRWIQPFAWDRGKEFEVAAIYWNWIVRKGRVAGQALGRDYLEIHYEELVQNPQASLSRLSDFVGQELNYDQIQKAAIGSVGRPNTSFSSELQSGGFQPVARWKNSLSEVQRRTLGVLIGETLADLGYEAPDVVTGSNASLHRLRSLYTAYFDAKFFAKTKTFLGPLLASKDLSWT